MIGLDDDLQRMNREELIAEIRRLRQGVREHRDASGHDLCWHHPQLWGLLPERIDPAVAVPPGRSFCADASSTAKRWSGSSSTRRCWTRSMTDPDVRLFWQATSNTAPEFAGV